MEYPRDIHMNMKQHNKQAGRLSKARLAGLGLVIAVSFSGLLTPAHAEPSSKVAWDSATRHLVASGDATAGKAKAATCSSCHGAEGIASGATFPNLAGQLAAYTFKQLKDYKAFNRGKGVGMGMMMATMMQVMSDKEMTDLAAYYASLPRKQAEGPVKPVPVLVNKGDGKRIIPACQACHGSDGKGRGVNVASLAGQNAGYMADTLKHYRSGARANDVYSRMRLIAKNLSDAEIDELAAYYASLK